MAKNREKNLNRNEKNYWQYPKRK